MIIAAESVPAATSILLGAILVVSGLFVIAIAQRGADGRIGPNRIAGVRTAATLKSPEAWMAAHEAALGSTKAAGWCSAIGGLTLIAWRPDSIGFIVVTMSAIGALLILCLHGAYRGHQAAKRT